MPTYAEPSNNHASLGCEYCGAVATTRLTITMDFGLRVCDAHIPDGKRDNNAWLHQRRAVKLSDFCDAFPAVAQMQFEKGILVADSLIQKRRGAWQLVLRLPNDFEGTTDYPVHKLPDAEQMLSALDKGFYLTDYQAYRAAAAASK